MPLWAAVVLLLLCVVGTARSFRVYSRGAAKIFLAAGIALALLSIAALLYVAAALLFVFSIP